jgi:RNA polymerase sigma factor (sigma-70 family)
LQNDKHKHLTDNELLNRFNVDNNNEWLGVLLQRYTLLLLGVCMKYLKNEAEAKDNVQQIFEKVINELHKYKVEYFKSWIYMIAKNQCLMQLRNKGKYSIEIDERLMATPDETEERKFHLEKDITLDNLALAIKQLNADQQLCVTLFYLQKKSYQQIVATTSFSLLQVKSNIQNGKRNLKLIMQRTSSNG